MSTTLSVIIPIYNVEPYIKKCIESVVRSVGEYPVEVLLIDDGSTDRSGEIADAYAKKYSYIHVIHRQNGGVASARNAGINRASGRWLYFMDSDDWLAEDGIALLCSVVEKNAHADMILMDAYQNIGEHERVWEHFGENAVWNQPECIRSLQRGILYYPMDYPTTKVPLAAPWDKVYNREFLMRHEIVFREELKVLDDMVFNMEVLGRAGLVSYEKQKIYHYRRVSASITNAYRADRVEQDRIVWNYIQSYRAGQIADGRWSDNEIAAFDQAYYCRIIRSFTICCRLNFYHKDNRRSHGEKQAYVRKVLKSMPYMEAFHRIRLRNLEWKLRIVVLVARTNLCGGLYLLHLIENVLN